MSNVDPSPFTGKDGQTAPGYGSLIAAKDGSGNSQDLTTTAAGSRQGLDVTILDGSGNQITSFGGGTQYADGAAQATPTGTVALGHDGSNVRAVTTDTDGDLQIDVKTMPTVNVNLQAGDGTDITQTGGALDVNIASGSSSGTEYTEDAAAAANPSGPMTMAVRADSLAGVTTTDGDNIAARATDKGELYVKHVDSIAVTNSALTELAAAINSDKVDVNIVSSSVATGGTSAADDDDFTDGTTPGTPAMGVYESTPSTVTDGDLGVVGITEDRRLKTSAVVTSMPTTTVQATDLDIRDLTNADVVTAELSATDNAVLDDIASKLGTIDADTSNISTKIDTIAGDTTAIETSVQLIDDTIVTLGTDTYTEATSKGQVIGGVRRDADTTLANTTNEFAPFQVDARGALKVEAFSGEALPVTDNGSTLSIDDGSSSITVDYATTGSGTATGALRVELPTNGTGVIATVSTVSALGVGTTGPQKAEDVASAGGDMGVAVMAARLDTPVANAGVSNDGDYTTPILDNYRKVWVTGTVPEDTGHVAGEGITMSGERRIDTAATSAGNSGDWATKNQSAEGASWVTTTPTTTSGCSIFRSLDIDETEEDVKTSAGNLYAVYFGNATSSIRYLKFYNATAANVTVGSTTPVLTFLIPASAAGWLPMPFPASFGTAISVACTTGVADADTGAPGANDVVINVLYK